MSLTSGYAKLKPKDGRRSHFYPDGKNLYLQVSANANGTIRRSWVFRYAVRGKAADNGRQKTKYMGLGSTADLTLEDARETARQCRLLLKDGLDPIAERNRKIAANIAAQAAIVTFAEAAERYIEANKAGWRNPKHAGQWESTLKTYAFPKIGQMSVADITTTHVMKIVEPIWKTKTETASRVRGRIEAVLDWALAHKYRQGDNPARWMGCLEKLLPAPSKVRRVEHHAALPYAQLPAFIADLRRREGASAQALEFLILTASRSGEVRGMTFDEIDFAKKVWTIPAARMKAGRDHSVPLSDRALELLRVQHGDGAGLVFPGQAGKPLSDMSLTAVMRRMNRADLTAHGFRSSFRDWAGDETDFAREIAEAALAHVVGDKAEQAYRRSDALEKRRRLMQQWADYCEGKRIGKVVRLRA